MRTKKELLEIARRSNVFRPCMNRWTKATIIEFLQKEGVLDNVLYGMMRTKKELLREARERNGFKRCIHGQNKRTLSEFLLKSKTVIDKDELRHKLIHCFSV